MSRMNLALEEQHIQVQNERFFRVLRVLAWALSVLAVVVVALGVLMGLSVANASSVIPVATIGFQSPALKPLWDTAVSGLHLLGSLILVSGVIIGLLVFLGGLLLARSLALTQRVQQLERTIAGGNPFTTASQQARDARLLG